MLPHVHILLCTKDGDAFLAAQLQSILAQTHRDWSLWISDDGSRDQTLAIVRTFMDGNPGHDIRLIRGPQKGCAQNFMSLLAQPGLQGAWVAFADQDDVWMPHKLARAVDMIWRGTGAQIYSSRSICADHQMRVIGVSPQFQRPFSFGNALVQNILRGNTLVMPPVITDLLRSTLVFSQEIGVPFHDWWIYQMVTGAGLDIIYDPKPGIFYRQHANNLLGAQHGHSAARAKLLLRRVFAEWVDNNIAAMHLLAPILDRSSRRLLFNFMDWRAEPKGVARAAPQTVGVYRQTSAGDLALRALARIGRL